MIRKILTFLCILVVSIDETSALIEYTKPTKAEIDSATKVCLEKGKSNNEEKYTCPNGSYQKSDGRVLSQQVVTCGVKMALTFSAIDESAKKWMKELQNQRNPDFNVWSWDIDTTVQELNDTYSSVCKTITWTKRENDQEVACANTQDFFSETACDVIARKKSSAWKNAWYILAAKGIAKNAQNDKDTFVDQKKTKYSELINKWNSYKRIVGNAVAKMTAYVRSPVK